MLRASRTSSFARLLTPNAVSAAAVLCSFTFAFYFFTGS
jgi:hypothetical protein